MFNKYQGVFRSRWKAVWWALGVCVTAYCTVPSPDQKESDAVVPSVLLPHAKASHKAVDPWAVDKPDDGQDG